ncbi:MAG: hypothetical protein V4514_13510 [Pseudomonadota bacterium]|uniref:hypothetical protein n=1 Tax=unclassified Phenylobacterium TaxID=2640670 RepID=UPI0006FC39B0|nr:MULTISPECIES: hypothetical protein [unclassified Phenylobacterium]KRB51135.1 hypothetical protein ASE02_14900 [Phenylobacterium sp. Root700]MBT9471537.1 hypothetical protein [Phenylobacterium sp.]
MNKTLFVLASVAVIASATSAAAGGSTKGTGGLNGVAQTGLTAERAGGSTKGTGGVNGVSQAGLATVGQIDACASRKPSVCPSRTSMKVLSVVLPTKADAVSR